MQEAIFRLFCSDFTEEDRVLIFLTGAARKSNWESNGDTKKGLKETLEGIKRELNIGFQIVTGDIPEGRTEKEIWEIFRVVFEALNNNDELILDVTHGFRSIPMLGLVLLNYARFLKNISVKGIFYGAYEARNENNEAPIFDITSFDRLLRWSNAADSFLNYGITGPMESLVKERAAILREKTENFERAKKLEQFDRILGEIAKNFFTVRGREILSGRKFEIEKQNINAIADEFIEPPFGTIKNKIQEKLRPFENKNSIKNCLAAVKWYIRHGLIQQGITLTQELIVTFILQYLDFPWDVLANRELVTMCITVYSRNIPEAKWDDKVLQERKKALKILSCEPMEKLGGLFEALREYRNDINHGGFLENARTARKFKAKLEAVYPEVERVISNYLLK